MRARSLKTQFLLGTALWTLGLLGLSHLAFVLVTQYVPHVLRVQHWTVLGLLALVFMLGGLSQVRLGLTSINQLRGRLGAVRAGQTPRIEGAYPGEVQPLVDDLNALLDHRENAVRRAQAKAGDLAHGLKTPLAVLAREADQAEAAGLAEVAAGIRGEVDRMRRQIDYHLAQARAAASAAAPGASCAVDASAVPLTRTLARLYAEKGVTIHLSVPPDLTVAVERQDLDELLGNLLDNACKWSRGRVDLTAVSGGSHVIIVIEDDGEGVSEALWEAVLSRGVRADEAAPGSGLGLAIVRDLAALYGGSVSLGHAARGGLRAELRLPRWSAPLFVPAD
jgi:signal transduction histidine kinase